MGATWRWLVYDSAALVGAGEGRRALAIGAVINAMWDLKAKRSGLPLWQLQSR